MRKEALKRFGRIDGVVLGAGTVRGAGLEADLLNGFELYTENFRGKIGGVKAALDVFGDDPLDFAVVLSSISVVLGGMGLSAYAAANHAVDLLVLNQRRRGRTHWVTSNWDLWVGGKIPEDHPRMTRFIGMAIRPEEGAEAIVNLLAMPPSIGQAIVSTVDLEQRINAWIRGIIEEAESTQVAQHKRPILTTTFAAPEGDLEERLAKLWSQVLGIDPIGRDDDFFEMGGHSLLAVQVAVRLQEFVPVEAPSANLYETPTVRGLAAALERRAGPTDNRAASATEAVG